MVFQVGLNEHQPPGTIEHPKGKRPCTRVTWLCQSSIGLILRLPYSSLCERPEDAC